jgi:hypothetical protein
MVKNTWSYTFTPPYVFVAWRSLIYLFSYNGFLSIFSHIPLSDSKLVFFSDLHHLCLLPTRRAGMSNRVTWHADVWNTLYLQTQVRVAIFLTNDHLCFSYISMFINLSELKSQIHPLVHIQDVKPYWKPTRIFIRCREDFPDFTPRVEDNGWYHLKLSELSNIFNSTLNTFNWHVIN